MNYILGVKFRDYGQIVFFSHAVPESGQRSAQDADRADAGLPNAPGPVAGEPAGPDAGSPMVGAGCGAMGVLPGCPVGIGDLVLAETGQGVGLGTVVHLSASLPLGVAEEEIRPIVRLTTPADRPAIVEIERLGREAFACCNARIRERGLDMKLVDVEILFDKSKFIFYFTAPTRIDFRELVKDLVREYHVRIELRQIGVRHETQMIGAVGNCGMVCCCRRFLRKFAPVTIKMAKEQNLFLNSAKISGICGRLLCCLSYEQENYDAFHRECPRLGKRYQTAQGEMKILRANMFRNSIVVLSSSNEELEFTLEEWQTLEPKRPESPAQPRQSRPYTDQAGHGPERKVEAETDRMPQADVPVAPAMAEPAATPPEGQPQPLDAPPEAGANPGRAHAESESGLSHPVAHPVAQQVAQQGASRTDPQDRPGPSPHPEQRPEGRPRRRRRRKN